MLHIIFHAAKSSSSIEDFKYNILFSIPTFPPHGQFLPEGHHLSKLGRSLLDNATYKVSKPYAMWGMVGWCNGAG